MSRHQAVVWSEGLLLTPQHFQQADLAYHHLMAERFRAAQDFEFGFTQLEVDREALRNGRFGLLSARGILPDGTPFSAPEDDPLPQARDIASHFEARQESLAVHLGLPSIRPGRAMLAGGSGADGIPPRFVTDTLDLPDSNTGLDERPVTTARRNLRILFPDDALGDHDHLQVAEIGRTSDNALVLRENYVPACLAVNASEFLKRQLRAEFEMLIATSNSLADKRRQRGSAADFADTDAAKFFQLGVVNGFIPQIAHVLAHPRIHPERVYLMLASLMAQLCTLVSEPHPKDLPPYDHMAIGRTFEGLDKELRKLLEVRMDDKTLRVELQRKDSSLYVGQIVDLRALEGSSSMFLGVKADAEEQRLINEVPYKVKIASQDKIDYLIANALRGVVVSYTRMTPTTLSTKGNYLYFQLDTGGDAFETVRAAKNIAIFLPPDYPGLTVELLGLRQ